MAFSELTKYLSSRDFGPSMEITSQQEAQYLPWNGLTCLSIVSYVLKFRFNSEYVDVFDTISRLDNLARIVNNNYVFLGDPQVAETSLVETFVNNFMPKVHEFFSVPRINGTLAGFIHFLLQILNSELEHIRLERYAPLHEGLASLQKELMFLLSVLGDTLFQFTAMEEVKNLLTEFETVAGKAGRIIYSCLFRICQINIGRFCVDIRNLLVGVFKLYGMIRKHCLKFSELSLNVSCATPRKTDAAHSLFIVNSLLEDLENYTTCHPDLIGDLSDQIKSLQDELISTRSFLEDVHVAQETDFQELKDCIVQVRDTAYEAEYLVNSFVSGNVPVWYLAVRLPAVIQKFNHNGRGFKEIKRIYRVKLSKLKEDFTMEVPAQAVVPTPMTVDNDTVVGFENKMLEILGELTGGSENLRVVSIFGMPGIGKTTLANKLYSHELISNRFDQCASCVVSQTYCKPRVLFDLLVSLRSNHDKEKFLVMDYESLVLEFYQSLKGRRYLIVLDDVWDSNVWDDLRRYFPDDRNGSRILFTTRNRDTCPFNSIIHMLPLLSKYQCWELIEKKVFHKEPCPPQLLEVGKQIAVQCKGLPLAVVVIAGILTNMAKEKRLWEKVKQSLNTYTSNYMKILELSYTHLPNHLKLCFLYLGLIPRNANFLVRKLIWLWIAEGFIQKDEGKSREHVAREYLKNLIDRSLVLVTKNRSTGGVKACSIHDLLREMCLKIAQEENFLSLVNGDHISTHSRLLSTAPSPIGPFSLCCRSFFGRLSDPSSCLPLMKHLRVMELSAGTYKLQKIDLVVHLRYLVVDRMPEPILGKLVNLEVLVVNTKFDVVYVPPILLKMDKLKHLHIKRYAKFQDDCDSRQPNNLQSLSFLSICSTKSWEVLASSPHLHKLKCLCPPQLPDFRFLTELDSLKIVAQDILRSPINNTEIEFPSTIKKLSLFGTHLPWKRMSILGRLPKLQVLKLFCKAFEGKKWMTHDYEFQNLKFLSLNSLELEQWIASSEHFPRLQHLVLHKCKMLQKIPTELGEIPTLLMIQLQYCGYEANRSASLIEQEQRDNGNEELKVIITNNTDLVEEGMLSNLGELHIVT